MATKTLLTVDDFMRLPESVGTQDVRYELVEGKLVTLPLEMLRHNLVRDNALVALLEYVDREKTRHGDWNASMSIVQQHSSHPRCGILSRGTNDSAGQTARGRTRSCG